MKDPATRTPQQRHKREYNSEWVAAHAEHVKAKQLEYRQKHRAEAREATKRWRAANPERQRAQQKKRYETHREVYAALRRACHIKKLYGITVQEYDVMYEKQGGACAICSLAVVMLHIDHDHETNRVRGLLCGNCNKALGLLRDRADVAELAAAYLRKHKPVRAVG